MIDVIIRKRGLKIMRFTKMHGIGNDYVYVNCLEENVENPSELSIKVSDRHFGIGSDGLILIKPSEKADFEMEMYNADGSQGAMCRNGIRCVAKYVYDYGLTDKTSISVCSASNWSDRFCVPTWDTFSLLGLPACLFMASSFIL